MDKKLILRERFLVVSHLEEDRPFRVVGSAYKAQDEKDLTLHLRILPGVSFYITPHRDQSGWEYVIFSGREKKPNGTSRFFAKVGSAILLPKKNAIEIHLPDLRQVYYLKLDPQDFHYDERAVAA